MKIFIYTLKDPRDNCIRYVGKTVNKSRRLSAHIHESKKGKINHIHTWVRSLLKVDLKPIMEEIDTCNVEEWEEREKYWIKYYKDQGFDLCNYSIGGQGCVGKGSRKYLSEEHRKILAKNLRLRVNKGYDDEEKVRIWGIVKESINFKDVKEVLPKLGKNTYSNIKNGRIWNDITGLLKTESNGKLKKDKHPSSKLNLQQVQTIRSSYNSGNLNQKQLSELYSVSITQISKIIRNVNW